MTFVTPTGDPASRIALGAALGISVAQLSVLQLLGRVLQLLGRDRAQRHAPADSAQEIA